MVVASA